MALTKLDPNVIGQDSTGTGKITSAGGSVSIDSSGNVRIANSSANNIVATASGYLGVGTSPAAPLHVKTQTDGNMWIRNSAAVYGGQADGIAIDVLNDNNNAVKPLVVRGAPLYLIAGSNNALSLHSNNGTVGLTLAANSNVGIGNTAPANILSVGGTMYVSGNTTIAGNTTTFASNAAVILPIGTTSQRPTGSAGMFRFNANTAVPEYHNGSAWVSLGLLDGSSPAAAAPSADAIYSLGIRTSGLYWLKPASWSFPAQFYCEMSLHGGGWIYIMQRQCYSTGTSNSSLPGSYLTGQSGTPNHATSNFYGVLDQSGAAKTPQDIWNGFVGSSSAAKMYAREIQTTNGSYDESQRYVNSSDGALFNWASFSRFFSGNYSNGTWNAGAVRVYYNNGNNYVDGKTGTTWSAPSLATINNGNSDQDLWFCNGTDSYDSNWGFGLMKGGTPFPATADSTNGGPRRTNTITRWGIIGIKA